MAHSDQLTAVTSISHRPVLLDDILRPLWKCLRFSGLHHGFLPLGEERRLVHILRRSLTVLIQALVSGLGVFQLVQLVIAIPNRKSIADVSLNVVISTYCLMAIVSMHQFYAQHDQLVQFFRDWRQVETSFFNCRNRGRVTKVARVLNCIFLVLTVSLTPLIVMLNINAPNDPVFFSHPRLFCGRFRVHFLVLIYGVAFHFTSLFFNIGEVLPSIFFFQAGCMIENLVLELELEQMNCSTSLGNSSWCHSRSENHYQLIWKRYESIQQLVKRANRLFGLTLIANQFGYICTTCLYIYLMIITDVNDGFQSVIVVNILLFVTRTLGFNWLLSHLYLSGGELRGAVAASLAARWRLLSLDHRNLLTSFLVRLDKGDLAARPLNLYTIQPANLLSLLTLHISYVIVLLQSS